MGLYKESDSHFRIVDRTLPEICELNQSADPGQLLQLIYGFKAMGVDLLEVDRQVIHALDWTPRNMGYLFKAADTWDVEFALGHGLRNILIEGRLLLDDRLYTRLSQLDLNITAEFTANDIREIKELYNSIPSRRFEKMGYLRFTGLSRLMGPSWMEEIRRIVGLPKMGVEICPLNPFHTGVAIAVEGIMNGAEGVAASFTGYGKERDYAALEEILMGVKVLINGEADIDLTVLPGMGETFTGITGRAIPVNKPVLGKNLFKYESGIHADGIDKNPITYEPFDPSTVGLKRQLAIGKHSGTRSVSKKLEDLMIYYDDSRLGDILKAVRGRSMELKRSLNDSEIRNVVREVCFYEC